MAGAKHTLDVTTTESPRKKTAFFAPTPYLRARQEWLPPTAIATRTLRCAVDFRAARGGAVDWVRDPIRSDPIRSYSIRSYPILFDLIRSYPILSDPILFDLIRSDLILSSSHVHR